MLNAGELAMLEATAGNGLAWLMLGLLVFIAVVSAGLEYARNQGADHE